MCIDLHKCQADLLDDPEALKAIMTSTAKAIGATVVSAHAHHFQPYGVSCMIILAESHLAAHTWPEHGFVAVDAFTCGDNIDGDQAGDHLKAMLKAESIHVHRMKRGALVESPK